MSIFTGHDHSRLLQNLKPSTVSAAGGLPIESCNAMRMQTSARTIRICVLGTRCPPAARGFLGAFLARIARNLSLDAYSKKNAVKRGSGEVPLILHELEECVSGSGFLLEAEGDNRLLSKTLDEFLGDLSKEARVFFVQRYWMSLSIKDISSRNHVSEGKVKMSLHRTRCALRKRLSQGGCEYEIAG